MSCSFVDSGQVISPEFLIFISISKASPIIQSIDSVFDVSVAFKVLLFSGIIGDSSSIYEDISID